MGPLPLFLNGRVDKEFTRFQDVYSPPQRHSRSGNLETVCRAIPGLRSYVRICLLSLAKLGMRMSKVRCEIIYMGLHNTWKPTTCVCTDGNSQKVSAEIVQSRPTSRSAFCVKQCCRCKGTGCVNCPLPFYLLASCPVPLNARTLGEPFA
jgi:hypothetical protein